MNLKRMRQLKLKSLLLSFLLIIMFVSGILMMIFSAIQDMTILLVLVIIFTGLGFYGTPIAWVRFGSLAGLQNTLQVIEQEKITELKKLSIHLSKNEKQVKRDIRALIRLNCLKGYTLDDFGNITTNQPKEETIKVGKCPHCSAPLSFDEDMIRCAYCGGLYTHQKKEQ